MSPRIAILAWGSLLWEGGAEFDRWHGQWKFDGPTLELEFCRISKSRLGALTLVIDTNHGSANTVAWSFSKRICAEDAVADLRCREGTQIKNIKQLVIGGNRPEGETARIVWTWAREKKLDVVVWTSLPSNFADKRKQPFSIEAAKTYLSELSPEGKSRAAEYIWRAPDFIETPLRKVMQVEPWFSIDRPEDMKSKDVVRQPQAADPVELKAKSKRSR